LHENIIHIPRIIVVVVPIQFHHFDVVVRVSCRCSWVKLLEVVETEGRSRDATPWIALRAERLAVEDGLACTALRAVIPGPAAKGSSYQIVVVVDVEFAKKIASCPRCALDVSE